MNTKLSRGLWLLLLVPISLPASLVTDRQMEVKARSSYIYQTVLQQRVKVSAEFGVLTLTGSVEDSADRALAESTAKSIAWVEEVKNKITIQSSFAPNTDSWMVLRILSNLRMRANVSPDTTRVAVRDGLVTLSGTVRDDAQKQRTGLVAAAVAGVKEVRNDLVIAPAPANEPVLDELLDDASITGLVISALRRHEATQALAIEVTTQEGDVRIKGEAESETQKAAVTGIVREVRGVRFVANNLKVGN